MGGISFNYKLLIGFFTVLGLFSLLFAYPILDFTNPTETNGTSINQNWAEVNLTVDMNESLDNFIFNWNSTNYTFYDSDLVLALNFNNNSDIGENSTYVVDISEYGNDGTFYDNTTYSIGKFGLGVSFDGDNDAINIPNDISLDINNSFAFEAWVYPVESQWQLVLDRGWEDYAFFVKDMNLRLQVKNATGSTTSQDSTTAVSLNQWSHIVASYNHTTDNVTFYINNIECGIKTMSLNGNIYNSGSSIKIGSKPDYSYEWKGTIDKVRIWNKALNVNEVSMHYKSEFKKYNSTQWRFYNNITSLTESEYTYYGWANDTASNENTSEIRYLTIDNTNPSIIINSPTAITYNNAISVLLNYTATDTNRDTCWYNRDDERNITLSSCENITVIDLENGTHTINVYVNDTAGNLNSTSVTFTTITPEPDNILDFVRVKDYHFVINSTNTTFIPMVGNSWHIFTDNYTDSVLKNTLCNLTESNLNVYRIFIEESRTEPSIYNYNDNWLDYMDKIIYYGNECGVKFIFPLQDYYWGSWYDSPTKDTQFVNQTKITAYKRLIRHILLRNNTLTGRLYRNDPSIFSWELMNEPAYTGSCSDFEDWGIEISGQFKHIDPNHMISPGVRGRTTNCEESTRLGSLENISFTTRHPFSSDTPSERNDLVNNIWSDLQTLGKPVIMEETGTSSASEKTKKDYLENEFFSAILAGGYLGFWSWENGEEEGVDSYHIWHNSSMVLGMIKDLSDLLVDMNSSFINSSNNIASCGSKSDTYLLCKYHASNEGYGTMYLYNPYGDNLVTDGGFEHNSSAYWSREGGDNRFKFITSESGDCKFGNQCIKANLTSSWNNLRQTGISVDTNTNYTVTWWMKGTGTIYVDIMENWDSIFYCSKSATSEWAQYSCTGDVKDNSTIVVSLKDQGTGTMYIDEVRMFKTDDIGSINIISEGTDIFDFYSNVSIVDNKDNYTMTLYPRHFYALNFTISGCLPPTDGTWEVNKNCTLTDETVSTNKTLYLNSPYVYLLENTTFNIGSLVIKLGGKFINDVTSNINIG